jgi:anti-sigma factor RsiW
MTEHDRDELTRWLNDLLDGDLSPQDARRLEARLRDDQQAREMYAASAELHANLEWRLGRGSAPAEPTTRDAWSRAAAQPGPEPELAESAPVVTRAEKSNGKSRLVGQFHLSRVAMALSIVVLLTAVGSAARLIVHYWLAQAIGDFDGRAGPAMLIMQLDADDYSEEQARGILNSMK